MLRVSNSHFAKGILKGHSGLRAARHWSAVFPGCVQARSTDVLGRSCTTGLDYTMRGLMIEALRCLIRHGQECFRGCPALLAEDSAQFSGRNLERGYGGQMATA